MGLVVEGAGRLVEQQNPGIPGQRRGYPDPLYLSAGKRRRVLPYGGVHAHRHRGDVAVHRREARRSPRVVLGQVAADAEDVAQNGALQHGAVLGHDADLPSDGAPVHLGKIPPVVEDRAGGRLLESEGEPDQRAFARARFPDDADEFARPRMDGHVLQHQRPVARVAEVDPVEHELPAQSDPGSCSSRRIRRRRQNGAHLLGHRNDRRNALDRAAEHSDGDVEENRRSEDREKIRRNDRLGIAAEHDREERGASDQRNRHGERGHVLDEHGHPHLGPLLLAVASGPRRERGLLGSGHPQLHNAADELEQVAGHPLGRLQMAPLRLDQRQGECRGDGDRRDADADRDPSHLSIVREDHEDHRQQEDQREQRLGGGSGYRVAQGLEAHRADRDVACGQTPEEAGPQAEQPVPDGGRDLARDAPLQAHQGRAARDVGERRHESRGGKNQRDMGKRSDASVRNGRPDNQIDGHGGSERQHSGGKAGRNEAGCIARDAAAADREQLLHRCDRAAARHRPVNQPDLAQRIGRLGVRSLDPARRRIKNPVSPPEARQKNDRLLVGEPERQHRPAVAEPPPILARQADRPGAKP